MRLVDLDPRWLVANGRRVGFTFISPKQRKQSDRTTGPIPLRQTCFVRPLLLDDQMALVEAVHGEDALAQYCDDKCAWSVWSSPNGDKDHPNIDAADFATMSCSPSLNGEKGGYWHGYITNGEIVGGI